MLGNCWRKAGMPNTPPAPAELYLSISQMELGAVISNQDKPED